MSTVVIAITAAAQNAWEAYPAPGTVTASPSSDATLASSAGNASWWGAQFLSSGIPASAQIVSAELSVYDTAGSGFGTSTVSGEKSVAAAAFAATSGNLSTRTRTSASVTRTGATTKTAFNDFGNVTAVVQELTNQAGWLTTSTIDMLITNTAASPVWAPGNYGTNSAHAATLSISYTLGTPGTPVAISTRILGTTSVSSASFTTTPNSVLVVHGTFYGVAGTPSISDTLGGLAWTRVSHGNISNLQEGIWWAKTPAAPATGTITLTGVGTSAALGDFYTVPNAGGVNATGSGSASNPSVTLSGSPATASMVFMSIGIRTAAAEGGTGAPTGFTLLGTVYNTGGATWQGLAYKQGNASQTNGWTEQNAAATTAAAAIEVTTLTPSYLQVQWRNIVAVLRAASR